MLGIFLLVIPLYTTLLPPSTLGLGPGDTPSMRGSCVYLMPCAVLRPVQNRETATHGGTNRLPAEQLLSRGLHLPHEAEIRELQA